MSRKISLPSLRLSCRAAGAAVIVLALAACSPPTPQEQLLEAQNLLQQGSVAKGVLRLKELVRENPEDPVAGNAHLLLAQYYASEGDAERVIEELQAARQIAAPGSQLGEQAAGMLLEAYLRTGNSDAALELADERLEAVPEDNPQMRTQLRIEKAALLLSMGAEEGLDDLRDEGLAILEEMMLESDVEDERRVAREQLAHYYRTLNEFEQSNEVYLRYLEAFPDETQRPDIEMAMGVNLMRAGDEAGAEDVFRPAVEDILATLEDEPDQEVRNEILNKLIVMHREFGDIERAAELMTQLMGENPMSRIALETQFRIGHMWALAGLMERNEEYIARGIDVFQKIAEDNPETEFSQTAETAIAQITEAREVMRQDIAAGEAAENEAAENTDDAAPAGAGEEAPADDAENAAAAEEAAPGEATP